MTGFWSFTLILSTMYPVDPGVLTRSLPEARVSQPDKELRVELGDSATLRCCVGENTVGMMALFKQKPRAQLRLMLKIFRNAGRSFSIEEQTGNFQTVTDLNCFGVIVSNITGSDEAVYYCALTSPDFVFADGTYLTIKGVNTSTGSETSKPVLCDPHGNTNTQVTTVLGLGSALGLCVLLIISLAWILLRRRKLDRRNVSMEDSPDTRQESDPETLNYAALHFKKKPKPEKRKTHPAEECVYSGVNQ